MARLVPLRSASMRTGTESKACPPAGPAEPERFGTLPSRFGSAGAVHLTSKRWFYSSMRQRDAASKFGRGTVSKSGSRLDGAR
jgi:hypothetical protein